MTAPPRPAITPEHEAEALEYPCLSPVYFATGEIATQLCGVVEALDLSGPIKAFTDTAYEQLMTAVQDHLLSDANANLHQELVRMVDEAVQAILSGKRWALDRYVTTDRYGSGEHVRKAIAEHFTDEVKAGRIADLEAEVTRLKKRLDAIDNGSRWI